MTLGCGGPVCNLRGGLGGVLSDVDWWNFLWTNGSHLRILIYRGERDIRRFLAKPMGHPCSYEFHQKLHRYYMRIIHHEAQYPLIHCQSRWRGGRPLGLSRSPGKLEYSSSSRKFYQRKTSFPASAEYSFFCGNVEILLWA